MSDKLHMEELMRTRLEGAEFSPSHATWKAIQRKLRWQQFFRFNPSRFNIYYAALILLTATALVFILKGERKQIEDSLPELISLKPPSAARVSEPAGASGQAAEPDYTGRTIQESLPASEPQNEATPDQQAVRPISDSLLQENDSEAVKDQSGLTEITPEASLTEQQLLPLPVAYFTTSINSGCVPLTVKFNNQSVHATSWNWDFGTGESSQEQNPVYEFREAGRYTVTLRTENHGSQPTVSRMMIEVLPAPVADFQIDEGLVGMDNHVVLNMVNYSSDAAVSAWNLVNEECTDCSDWSSIEHQPSLELKSITPESRAVRLEVINDQGCSDTAIRELPLIVQSSETRIKFATAFSPNPSGPSQGSFTPGSRRMDLFYPIYIEVPVEFHMRIYTRRGELVFESREIYQGWDGYLHQEPAPGDVYVWMAEGKWKDGKSFSLRGDVTLVWNQYW